MALLEGTADLTAKLKQIASEKELKATLRAMVRTPMRGVMAQAKINVERISPGKRALHRTYKGRLVSRGFTSRSIRMAVRSLPGAAYAIVGVLKEAFYALQFLELGTSKIPAQPWLLPAFYRSKDKSILAMADIERRRVEAIAKKRATGR